jgi:hypothetical protein
MEELCVWERWDVWENACVHVVQQLCQQWVYVGAGSVLDSAWQDHHGAKQDHHGARLC